MKTVIEIDHATYEVVITGAVEGKFVLIDQPELVARSAEISDDFALRPTTREIAKPAPELDLKLHIRPLPRPGGYGWHFSYNGAIL